MTEPEGDGDQPEGGAFEASLTCSRTIQPMLGAAMFRSSQQLIMLSARMAHVWHLKTGRAKSSEQGCPSHYRTVIARGCPLFEAQSSEQSCRWPDRWDAGSFMSCAASVRCLSPGQKQLLHNVQCLGQMPVWRCLEASLWLPLWRRVIVTFLFYVLALAGQGPSHACTCCSISGAKIPPASWLFLHRSWVSTLQTLCQSTRVRQQLHPASNQPRPWGSSSQHTINHLQPPTPAFSPTEIPSCLHISLLLASPTPSSWVKPRNGSHSTGSPLCPAEMPLPGQPTLARDIRLFVGNYCQRQRDERKRCQD